MRWIWDTDKDRLNRQKHGIGFETALRVFADPFAMSEQDRHEDGEERWQTIGMIDAVLVVMVATRSSRRTKALKPSGLSPPAEPLPSKGDDMKKKGDVTYDVDPANMPPLTADQRRELDALAAMPDESIDTSDIPELSGDFWRNSTIGRFYRPVKQQLTLRIDADVVEWFKRQVSEGKGYQTRINLALREYVRAQEKKAG